MPTNALYGFIRMILKLIKEESPDNLAIVFDTAEPTFRDELYEDYKANRDEPPDDLVPQFPYFESVVEALNIKHISMPGFEADDVIGTVAKKAVDDGYDVVVITGDKDFMQLVGDHISLYDTMKEKRIGCPEVKKKFGVLPEQVTDVMGLVGDSSDNIPGVRGIGPKNAEKLINQYKTLENLLDSVDKISNLRAKNALKEHADDARLSKVLATIKIDVPLEYEWSEFGVGGPDVQKMKELFSELEFFKLLRELLPTESNDQEKAEPDVSYSIISGSDELTKLAEKLRKENSLAISFFGETGKSAYPYVGIGISWSKGLAVYIPVAHETLEEVSNIDVAEVGAFFKALKSKKKYLFGAKEILRQLPGCEHLPGEVVDVKLMSYVLDPSYPADLLTLGQQLLGLHSSSEGEKKKSSAKIQVSVHEAMKRAGTLADFTLQLADQFIPELSGNEKLDKLFNELEMPLMKVLLKMEEVGILLDVDKLNFLSKEYSEKIVQLETKIYKEAGEKFAINSPKQLSHILFERLELPVIKKTKTGYSTDAGVLTQLAEEYELPSLVLEYRSLAKLKSTYIDALPVLVDNNQRVHTTFNQAVTATGRLSSSDPNLQNIPIRSEEGLRIREAFIAKQGSQLVSADYSQIELRILAHISGEEALVQAFKRGEDVHSATAAKLFGVDESEVDGEMRAAAKTVNFGVLYGQGAFGLSKQLDIEVVEADQYIKNYYKNYPKVKKLKEKIIKEAEKSGFVETIFGRRRYVPDIKSSNKSVKAFAERTAFNAVFQGTAADIIKMAMLDIEVVLEKDFPDVSMLLQVHDELVFEVPSKQIDKISPVIRKKMCEVVELEIPLEVDIGTGQNWAKCK
jgi:DNA polymerase-1